MARVKNMIFLVVHSRKWPTVFRIRPTCAATWAIMRQAVVGEDFETRTDQVQWALQQLVLGKTLEDGKMARLRYSQLNVLPMPYGHRHFFDDNPILLVVPILDPLNEVKNWKAGTEYWVMCIVGDGGELSPKKWYNKIFSFGPE